jgi:hypothetical protein
MPGSSPIPSFPVLPIQYITPGQLRNALMDRDQDAMVDNGERSMRAIYGSTLASDDSFKATKRARGNTGTGTHLMSCVTTVRAANGQLAARFTDKKTSDYDFISMVCHDVDKNNKEEDPPDNEIVVQ